MGKTESENRTKKQPKTKAAKTKGIQKRTSAGRQQSVPPSQTLSEEQQRIHTRAFEKQEEFGRMFWGEDGMRHIPLELMTLRQQVDAFKESSTANGSGRLGIDVAEMTEHFQNMFGKVDEWEKIEGMDEQDSQLAYRTRQLLESHNRDVQDIQERFRIIAQANAAIEEHGANLTSGNRFLETYRAQAEKYKRDGQGYPQTWLIDQTKENIKKYKKEDAQIQAVRQNASADMAVRWKKNDPLRKEVEKKVVSSEKLHKEIREYRKGNHEFQKVAGDLEGTIQKLRSLYEQVILAKPEETRSAVRKLEEAYSIQKKLETRSDAFAMLRSKSEKMKMSTVNAEALIKYSGQLKELQDMADNGTSSLQQKTAIHRQQRKREARENYQGKMSLMLSDKVSDAKKVIMQKMEEYLSTDKKWELHKGSAFMEELKAAEGTYEDEKESLQSIYREEKKPDAVSGESRLTPENISSIEQSLKSEDLDARRKEFEKKKQRITETLEVVDHFDKEGSQAHPVMQIIRRVKRLENAGGALSDQEQPLDHGTRDAVLDHMSLEGGLTAAVSKVLKKDEEVPGTVIEHGMELQDAATSGVADFGGEADAFKDGKSLLDTPKGLKETKCALSVVSAVSGAIQCVRSIINFFRGMKGKSSSQKWEEGMNLVDELTGAVNDIIDAGDGIAEFFNADFLPDNPIMSTARAVVKIAADLGGFYRAVHASGVMEKKEESLWSQMSDEVKSRKIEELGHEKEYRRRTRVLAKRKREEERRGKSYTDQKLLQDRLYRTALIEELEKKKTAGHTGTKDQIRAEAEREAAERINAEEERIGGMDYRKSARASDALNQDIISRRYEEEQKKREAKAANDTQGYEKAKARIKDFKALERHGEFQIAAEARSRQYNVENTQMEDIIKEGIKVAASWLKTSAMPATAIAGIAMEIGVAVYNATRKAIAKVVQVHRDKVGAFYSTANKQYRRSKMAELMYDRMRVAAGHLNDSGRRKENLTDWQMKALGDNLSNLKTDFLGVGMKTGTLLRAVSREEMIQSMAEAFGTQGQA